jgi:predicted nucleic-acid-binding Zn-ribbon protein
MPVPPSNKYIKSTCVSCGWSDYVPHRSDVICHLNVCRRCGKEEFTHESVEKVESLLSDPVSVIRSMFRN